MRRWASHGERGRGGDIQTPYRLRQADVHPCSTPQVKRANKNERLRSPTPQFEPVPLLLGLRLFVVARPALEDWTGRPLVRPMGLHNNPSRLSSPASGPIRRLQLHRSTTTTTPPPPPTNTITDSLHHHYTTALSTAPGGLAVTTPGSLAPHCSHRRGRRHADQRHGVVSARLPAARRCVCAIPISTTAAEQ